MGSGTECIHPYTKDDGHIVTSCRHIIAHSDRATALTFQEIMQEHYYELDFAEVDRQRSETTNACAMKYGTCRWF